MNAFVHHFLFEFRAGLRDKTQLLQLAYDVLAGTRLRWRAYGVWLASESLDMLERPLR